MFAGEDLIMATLSIKPYAHSYIPRVASLRASSWIGSLQRRSRIAGARLLRFHRKLYPATPSWKNETERGGRLVMFS
jgi:hypothetical protein